MYFYSTSVFLLSLPGWIKSNFVIRSWVPSRDGMRNCVFSPRQSGFLLPSISNPPESLDDIFLHHRAH